MHRRWLQRRGKHRFVMFFGEPFGKLPGVINRRQHRQPLPQKHTRQAALVRWNANADIALLAIIEKARQVRDRDSRRWPTAGAGRKTISETST